MSLKHPILITERLCLKVPDLSDTAAYLAYEIKNREHHKNSAPFRPESFYTEEGTKTRIQSFHKAFDQDSMVYFLIFFKDQEQPVIGHAVLSQISRGSFQAAYLGFAIDQDLQGQGLMTEACQSIVAYGFKDLKLHRLMAGHRPDNLASSRVLEKLGFKKEGLAEDYLYINDEWQDHVLRALVNRDFIWE